MAQTVAEVLVATLEEIGVLQVFGLIGDSLNPLGRRYPAQQDRMDRGEA